MGLTLTKLYDYFDAAALVEGSTKQKCRTSIRKLVTCFGDLEAEALRSHHVGQWQLWMHENGLRRTSIPGYCLAVSQVYTWAIEAELLAVNPFKGAKKMRAPKPEVVTFTTEEIADLIAAVAKVGGRDRTAPLRWAAMLLMASTSGLRIGEIHNLRWDDIDLEAAVAHVRYRENRFGQYWEWGSKTMCARIVPLGQEALDCYHRLAEVATWRYPHLSQGRCERLQARAGSIPENQRKRPYNNFYIQWRRIKAYANGLRRLRGDGPIKEGALHTMRKTAVTDWIEKGTSIVDAQCIAGHASKTTTLVYYTAVNKRAAVANVRNVINA